MRPTSDFRTVFCATCYAGPGEMCSDPRSTRFKRVGYHVARKRELWAKQRRDESRHAQCTKENGNG